MAKRNKRKVEEPKALTRKDIKVRAKDQEKNRKVMLGAGVALGLVLLVVLLGAVSEFVLTPRSAVATIGTTKIETQDFRKRVVFEQANLQNQLFQYQQFEAQFGGGQSLFASQIAQIQGVLASPFSLGLDVLDTMIEEEVLKQKAVELGVSVSDDEVDTAIREEVAAIQGEVTIPQATSTAEAEVAATATAALFTPTPLPTVDASAPATVTVEAPATPEPQATRALLTDTSYQAGLQTLESNLKELSGMDLATYREITRSRLLRAKLSEQIGPTLVTSTEEQVNARHILLRFEEAVAPAVDPTPVAEGQPTPEPTPVPRTDEETLALATEIRQRIVDGEDFAVLAAEFSEDPGSAVNGGDLGWFPKGMMVAEFEDAAFSLPIGEVSEPIQTQFGYHLIQVVERDENRAKDESQIAQEEGQAFVNWISEQVLAANVERASNLDAKLPLGL